MKPEIKNKIYAILVFIAVITVTVGIIQLVGIGIDSLRKRMGLDNVKNESLNQLQNISTSTEVVSTSTEIIDGSSALSKYNTYKKISIYPNGIETPSDYIKDANKALTNAGVKIEIKGNIEDAFIYIKAGANDESGNFSPIKKQFDGIWFYLKNGSFNGGIMDLSKSILGQPSELTELLFNLKNVPLAKNNDEYRKNNYENKNLLLDLKDNRFIGALVSTDRYGKIIELTIGYKCSGGDDNCLIKLK